MHGKIENFCTHATHFGAVKFSILCLKRVYKIVDAEQPESLLFKNLPNTLIRAYRIIQKAENEDSIAERVAYIVKLSATFYKCALMPKFSQTCAASAFYVAYCACRLVLCDPKYVDHLRILSRCYSAAMRVDSNIEGTALVWLWQQEMLSIVSQFFNRNGEKTCKQ